MKSFAIDESSREPAYVDGSLHTALYTRALENHIETIRIRNTVLGEDVVGGCLGRDETIGRRRRSGAARKDVTSIGKALLDGKVHSVLVTAKRRV